jgi:GxxExxY protein
MPVKIDADVRRLSQNEFGAVAFKVMAHAFDVHRQLGRLFDESVYQTELAHRLGAPTEVRLEISHDGFQKIYFLDLLVENGALFEIKTVDSFHERHRSQLLNYLLLTGLAHGKLINFRTSAVQHEFVNTSLTRTDFTRFDVDDSHWQADDPASLDIKHRLIAMLRDVGAGLDLQLYREAIIHWLGGPAIAVYKVDVLVGGRRIGTHELVRTPGGAGIQLTCLKSKDLRPFEDHYLRFLSHVDATALHWINITWSSVMFRTLRANQ